MATTEADWRREEDGDTDPEEHSDSEFIVTGDPAFPRMCVARNDMPERIKIPRAALLHNRKIAQTGRQELLATLR